MKRKITNENIKPFMSFGKIPSANGFLEKEFLKKGGSWFSHVSLQK